jgi:hypothetical protein
MQQVQGFMHCSSGKTHMLLCVLFLLAAAAAAMSMLGI